jgi:NADH-quinone oxidoreductase subunit J
MLPFEPFQSSLPLGLPLSLPLGAILLWQSFFFWLFALITCAFALGVLFASNVVRMALYLIVSLSAAAGLMFIAGAEFVGAMQIMIYVGGTLVLLVFGVMLTAQDAFVSLKTKGGEWIMALLVGGAMLLMMFTVAYGVRDWREPSGLPEHEMKEIAVNQLATTTKIGVDLTGKYLLPFELVGVHLLVVLVGAAYLARTTQRTQGARVAAAAAVAPLRRARPFSLTLILGAGFLINVGLALACFFASEPIIKSLTEAQLLTSDSVSSHGWLFPALGVFFAVQAVMSLVVMGWQRWGVIAMVVIPLLQVVAMANAQIPWQLIGMFLILSLTPVMILCGLLLMGGNRSLWSEME